MISKKEISFAAGQVCQTIAKDLPAPEICEHIFSEKFEVEMALLIQKESRHRQTKPLQWAMSILLFLLISAGFWLALDVDVRAGISNLLRTAENNAVVYQSMGIDREEHIPQFVLCDLPAGYVLLEEGRGQRCGYQIWERDRSKQEFIMFDYTWSAYGGISVVQFPKDTEILYKQVKIGEQNADLYFEEAAGKTFLIWMDKSRDIVFSISASCSEKEVLRMAREMEEVGTAP